MEKAGPLLGNSRQGLPGSAYQAISATGETVFFTAKPTMAQQPMGEQQTVYARVRHSETIAISNPSPSECTTCNAVPAPATYQGASGAGSKAFFTTAQQLTDTDKDATNDLYMYDFSRPSGHHIVQLSGGGIGDSTPGVGAGVQGVVRTSADGSAVYFVAAGVLTTVPNREGQLAQAGGDNLYAVDTNNGKTKFVAELCSGLDTSGSVTDVHCPTSSSDSALWGADDQASRLAQTTPEGRYLVFSTFADLSLQDTNSAQAVYRYDASTCELTWISHTAPNFAPGNEAKNASIAGVPALYGAEVDINDWNRTLSENGKFIIFTTREKLQPDDLNNASDVYLWHDGTVSLISDGVSRQGVNASLELPSAAISASGSDIFFLTQSQLVGQDTDVLQDLYDARISGGFPAQPKAPSCTGEEWSCQGKAGENPAPPKPEGSATQQPGDNLTPAPFKEALEPEAKPRRTTVTRPMALVQALQRCKKARSRPKRQSCEKRARKMHGSPKVNQGK